MTDHTPREVAADVLAYIEALHRHDQEAQIAILTNTHPAMFICHLGAMFLGGVATFYPYGVDNYLANLREIFNNIDEDFFEEQQ